MAGSHLLPERSPQVRGPSDPGQSHRRRRQVGRRQVGGRAAEAKGGRRVVAARTGSHVGENRKVPRHATADWWTPARSRLEREESGPGGGGGRVGPAPTAARRRVWTTSPRTHDIGAVAAVLKPRRPMSPHRGEGGGHPQYADTSERSRCVRSRGTHCPFSPHGSTRRTTHEYPDWALSLLDIIRAGSGPDARGELLVMDEGRRLICFTTEMAPGHHLWVRIDFAIDPSPEIEVLHHQRADIATRIRTQCSGFRICRDEWADLGEVGDLVPPLEAPEHALPGTATPGCRS